MPSAKQKIIKRQKQYAQNKDVAKRYMKDIVKKKDSIQLSKKEYYYENKIKNSMKVNYEENKDDKRQYYVENKDAKRLYYDENKDTKRQYYKGKKDDKLLRKQGYQEIFKTQQSSTYEKMSKWCCRQTFALLTAQRLVNRRI